MVRDGLSFLLLTSRESYLKYIYYGLVHLIYYLSSLLFHLRLSYTCYSLIYTRPLSLPYTSLIITVRSFYLLSLTLSCLRRVVDDIR